MQSRVQRSLRFFVWAVLAGCAGAMIPPESVAAEGQTPVASAGDQARLDRAESLLDSSDGQGEILEEAKAELDRVLRDDPGSANAYRLYARYYLNEGYLRGDSFQPGTLEAAEKALEKSIQIAPDYARAYVLQGHVFNLMGKTAQARAALEKAERLGTKDPWLHLNMAQVLEAENRRDEAAKLYRKVLAGDIAPRTNLAAREGLIGYYTASKRLAEADKLYRDVISAQPDRAWSYGNYARFLLCWRDDAKAAAAEATKALDLMEYGWARMVLNAALYRQWAALALDRNKLADEAAGSARNVLAIGPATAIEEVCGGGPTVLPVLEAMLLTGDGERIPAKLAGVLAADAEDRMVSGLFVMKVQASGRDRNRLFLNSEADYRDARNLSLVFTAEGEAAFKQLYGSAPDEFLQGKEIVALGTASQIKVYFLSRGQPTDKYYYQTQMLVAKPEHIRISE